jgi:putative membrane protein insertion efficiency factor
MSNRKNKSNYSLRKVATLPFLAVIYVYKYLISPLLPGGCRHYPTCSVYAIDALRIHGPGKGLLLATNRILRCHPWGTHGIDPVPLYFFKKINLKKYGLSGKRQIPCCDRLKQ